MGIEPLMEKWKAFGWNVISANGHDFESLLSAFSSAEEVKGKPTVVIAETMKGKGVSIFEGRLSTTAPPPSDEELILALKRAWGGCINWLR